MCLAGPGSQCCRPHVAALLLLLFSWCTPPCVAVCPAPCLCAVDIISCSASNLSSLPSDLPCSATRLDLGHNLLETLPSDWTPRPWDRLTSLLLNRNLISWIDANSFNSTPHLQLLDLSSNRLTVLGASVFAALKDLQKLLIFDNQIIQVLPGAFRGLHSLQMLYLSGNRLEVFPLETLGESGRVPQLNFIDISNNNISLLPVQSLLNFSRRGWIYVQQNPLVCDHGVRALLQYWTWKLYRPLLDFREEFPCGSESELLSVSQMGASDLQTYQVEPGRAWLWVPCPGLGSANQEQAVFWVTPTTVVNSSSGGPTDRTVVLSNGTLLVRGALLEDGGIYECVAAGWGRSDPSRPAEVNVIVGNVSSAVSGSIRGSEHFNTAFTTLVTCGVSVTLVLLYLFLTPCWCRVGHGGCRRRVRVLCSDPEVEESGKHRYNEKRVAFTEPQMDDSDLCDPKTPSLGHVTTDGILKNGNGNRSAGTDRK